MQQEWFIKNSNQLNMRWNSVPPHPGYRSASSSVHYTTRCKHSLCS